MRTISLRINVPSTRTVEIQLPADTPTGPADLAVTIGDVEDQRHSLGTLGDLMRSSICGLWADRRDIEDPSAFARMLRKRAESRGG